MKKNKIKILYTIPNFDTAGSGKVVYDLVNNLDKEVFEPEICCFHDRGDFFKVIKRLGVKIHIFPFAINYRPFLTFPFRLLKIVNFLKKHKFDIIHSWHWSSDFSEPFAAKLTGTSYIYTKKAMGWGNRAWRWRTILSSKVVTINSDMKLLFFKNETSKISEIPLGVDTSHFMFQDKIFTSPEGIVFAKNDFVIVSIVNLVPVKGIEILLNAVNLIGDKSIKVVIVGGKKNEYGELLESKYASDAIFFVGRKLDINPYLALSDLFVIPTKNEGRKEGLPIAPLEAMSSGRIVIGSNVSGIKDVLKAFPNCIFKPDSVESLKDKISEIKNLSKKEKIQLQKEMRTEVETHFSKTDFIKNHEMLYKELVK